MRFFPSKMLCRLLVAALLVSLGLGASGCVNVSRKVIQGTGRGADWAVVPACADYELVSLTTAGGTRNVAQFGKATDAAGAPLPDYAVVPLAEASPWLATVVAGAVGALVAFGVAWFVARALAAPGPAGSRH